MAERKKRRGGGYYPVHLKKDEIGPNVWRTWCSRKIELHPEKNHTHNPRLETPVYYNKHRTVLVTESRSQTSCFQCVAAVTKEFMGRD